MAESVDVAVIGLGPGGEHAASELARAGLSVLGVEKHLVGGECPYYGCIPTKMAIRVADALAEARRVPALGGKVEVSPDWATVAARISDEATDAWDDRVAVDRLVDAGARFARGRGRLAGPGRVVVETDDGSTEDYDVRRGVVLNVGTSPAAPPIDGLADTPYWTNRDIVQVRTLPASLLVLGGGAIGCELAQALARFGVEVTVLEAGDRILGPEEPEASELVTGVLEGEGITVRTGVRAERVDHDGSTFRVTLAGGGSVTGAALLVAAGRRTNLSDLGLETVGLDPAARFLETDERMRATDGVWAIGDVTGKGMFTHVSMYQGSVAVRDLLGRDGPWADYTAVSRVTFTDPEVGSVGMTEAQARDAGIRVATGSSQLPSSSRGWIHKVGNEGLVKVVADADRGVLVGATTVGPAGGEMIGLLSTAVHAAVPVDRLRTMHFAYPTFHRGIEDALTDLDL